MKVYFSHGRESGPWGQKIKNLSAIAKEYGCAVESIDYTSIDDPDQRVEHLLGALKQETDDYMLVGSSMGGYVSLVVSERTNAKAVFLLAPALYMPDYKQQSYQAKQHIEIVHGWSDDIIPPENSIRFAKSVGCTLHLISGDHRLRSSIDVIAKIFAQFLATTLGNVRSYGQKK